MVNNMQVDIYVVRIYTRIHFLLASAYGGQATFGWKGEGVTLMPVVYILTP